MVEFELVGGAIFLELRQLSFFWMGGAAAENLTIHFLSPVKASRNRTSMLILFGMYKY